MHKTFLDQGFYAHEKQFTVLEVIILASADTILIPHIRLYLNTLLQNLQYNAKNLSQTLASCRPVSPFYSSSAFPLSAQSSAAPYTSTPHFSHHSFLASFVSAR